MDTFGSNKGQFLPEGFVKEYGHLFAPYVNEFSSAKTYEERMKVSSRLHGYLDGKNEIEKLFRAVKDKVNFKSPVKSRQFRTRGNSAYQNEDNKKALKLYTKSISRAPLDSSELALAYANRSAVLRSMKKCRECLVDIERALSHGYPRDTSFKLMLREMQCHRDMGNTKEMDASYEKASGLLQSLSKLTEKERSAMERQLDREKQAPRLEVCNEEVIFPTVVPELSYGVSTEVVGVSSAVKLEYNEQQGDVLLITKILVATVNDCSKFDHCAHCQKPCHNLLPCSNCVWTTQTASLFHSHVSLPQVLFCSAACQTEANQKYHKRECAPYSRMRHLLKAMGMLGEFYDRIIRLLAQIGLDNLQPYFKYARTNTQAPMNNEAKRTQGFNSSGIFDTYNLDAIFNTSSMINCRDQLNFLFEANNLLYIPRCFGMSLKHRDFHAVAGLCLQLRDICEVAVLNKAYYLSKPGPNPLDVALCFDPLNALINHGCFYNLTSVTCANRSVRMAKWPIAKGSVLTEFYIGDDFMQYPKEVRQRKLKESYSFDCKCEACEKNWDIAIKYNCISDPKDDELATKLFPISEKQIMEMCRSSPRTDLASKVDDFRKERYKLLTRLWEKGEFQDFRSKEIVRQIMVYNFMQGNRLMHHVGKHDEEDQKDDVD
ncbi:hypothetical protein B566_EDAN010841, partial [Ephemera danica]